MSNDISDNMIDIETDGGGSIPDRTRHVGRLLRTAWKAAPFLGAAVIGAVTTVVLRRR